MRNPADISLRHPKVVLLLVLLAASYGWLGYLGLPRQENPRMHERHAEIRVYLPGAPPDRVERLVTKMIEAKVAEVDDVLDIFSHSGHGSAAVLIELQKSAPLAQRLQELRAKTQEVRPLLPEGASDPEINTEALRTNTMVLALTLERPLPHGRAGPQRQMRTVAQQLERDLQQLPGVRSVSLQGLPGEEIEVEIDLPRLAQRHLGMSAVVDALSRRNVALPSGEIEIAGSRSSILTSGVFDAVEEVGTTLISVDANGGAVRLGDVSRIRRRMAEQDVIVRHDGAPAVTFAIEMQYGRNAIHFGERVRAWMEEARPTLPGGFTLAVVADEPTYVDDRLSRLFGNLRIGMLLVAAVTFLGMGWRSGAVVSLSIPLSMVVAFGFMAAAGIELTQISIAALVIGIGLVVDEAIVVTDSIQRHIDRGESPRRAAVRGLAEIHLAVLAGAATTVAAFIPLFVMEGDIGDFVGAIPAVVSLMLLGSVLVAHFVTPLACVIVHERLGRRVDRARQGREGTIARDSRGGALYRRVLRVATRHPVWILLGFAGALASSIVAVGIFLWPPEFFGAADRHQFLIEVRTPSATPVERTAGVMSRIGVWLSAEPDVASWTSYAGSEAPKFYYNEFPSNRAESTG